MNHVSVLMKPALDYLAIRPDGVYVDATFGAGGHSRSILERMTAGRLIALDADPLAHTYAQQITDARFTFVQSNFRELAGVLRRCGVSSIDGILFDLGASSMQFDDSQRGFSLSEAGPIDMRMDPYGGRSAYDVLTTASERELAEIFFTYGEERAARRIAQAIVTRRESGRMPTTTTELAQLVSGILQRPGRRERIHPATRVFQALRIAVNDELGALRAGLHDAIGLLRGAGRVVAISFHSLEDRIVKQSFRDDERLDVLTRRPISPDDEELAENSRARSAKLRAAERRMN